MGQPTETNVASHLKSSVFGGRRNGTARAALGRSRLIYPFLFVALLFCSGDGFLGAKVAPFQLVLLKVDRSDDQKTLVKKSTIPDSGKGLFAAVKISKGEIIGKLGGRLVSADAVPINTHYLAAIPECARKNAGPYR